ncbi:MAG TPA: hypothetical protein PL151_14975 [Phycisphaerae bacterium]|nr:hypothetical protein [Phycisphaerae bacterium]HOJ75364.1 hypothetical protein [Phycisphaerae bacterium]HOM52603.1 hypothetical protein [Phycisphaerae bacterium]HON69209.1 hypothetical protein [Phycisphaerae bacterium]HOQ85422.1 hypothetical protein [Phycisphaerae bacterium]
MLTGMLAISNNRFERLRYMQDRFNESDPQAYVQILIAFVAILAIFAIIRFLNYCQTRERHASSQAMSFYLRVQSQMGLPLLDRWLLWRLARASGGINPTALLISPVLFDRAVERYLGPAGLVAHTRLAAIRRRLFGQAAPLPIAPVDEP